MPYFVINGKPDCPNFAHATFVAQYLSEKLPNFAYKKIEMAPRDFAMYLEELNKANKWHVCESPVIWKELYMWGGKKYLIGGLSEFWEHVYCYYGLESLIPKYSLQELAADNLKFFKGRRKCDSSTFQFITILGAANAATALLIQELIKIKQLKKCSGIVFKFYEHWQCIDNETYQQMIDIIMYFNGLKIFGCYNLIELCESSDQAIADSDIIIYLEDFSQQTELDPLKKLDRCNYRMKIFADILLALGKRDAKIILANTGPVCYMATCLWTACFGQFPHIVAVTADQAFPYIAAVSEATGILVSSICAPAVWGSIGLNSFVDVKNMLYKADMYRPYRSSLTSPKGSTLPLGTVNSEIRLMSYKIKDVTAIKKKVEEGSKRLYETLGRFPIFSKVRAIVSLIKLWYAEEVGDEIISLGIPSNGTFKIPEGIVFSQPAKLDEQSRKWVPYAHYPLMDHTSKKQIRICIKETRHILEDRSISIYTDESYDDDSFDSEKFADEEMGEEEHEEDFVSVSNDSDV